MAQNYVLLERIELNQTASSVTFANIPQTGYTDLKLVISARCDTTGYYGGGYQQAIYARFNSSATSYSNRWLQAEGNGSVNSGTNGYFTSGTTYAAVGTIDPSDWTANTFSNIELYIPNYTSSNNKSYSVDGVAENNGTFGSEIMIAGLWSSSSAINTIAFSLPNGNFTANSTFSLYGIANASTTPAIAPKASGGNVIATDGTYWYHAFLSNGTFTPQVGLSADVLVVAGGGAGGSAGGAGYNGGAGGGAGGLRVLASQSLVNSVGYICTIGAGGTAASSTVSTAGVNSSFAGSGLTTISVTGGGFGGRNGAADKNGGNGGSGGGAGATSAIAGTAGTGNAGSYSPVEGYNGGAGSSNGTTYDAGGGGGGAGAVGGAASSGACGAGGAGANTYNGTNFSTWLSTCNAGSSGYIAGGGGGGGVGSASGGTAGSGGGGAGTNGGTPTAGTINTGSGGGGAGAGATGGAGGSGIIIIRYAV